MQYKEYIGFLLACQLQVILTEWDTSRHQRNSYTFKKFPVCPITRKETENPGKMRTYMSLQHLYCCLRHWPGSRKRDFGRKNTNSFLEKSMYVVHKLCVCVGSTHSTTAMCVCYLLISQMLRLRLETVYKNDVLEVTKGPIILYVSPSTLQLLTLCRWRKRMVKRCYWA